MKDRWRLTRLFVRLGCFVVAVVLLWPAPFWPESSKFVVGASPFIAICSLIASGSFKITAVAGLIVAVISAFRKRWFCRYICPTGLLQDGAFPIGLKKCAWWSRCPPVGRYIVIATTAGALFGYPLLLWMDPLALFSSAFSIRTATHFQDATLAIAGLIILLLIALTSDNLWCSRLCPLGAMQEYLAELKLIMRRMSRQSVLPGGDTVGSAVRATRRAFLAVVAGIGLGLLAKRAGSARGEMAPMRPPGSIDEDEFSGVCVRCGNCVRACPSSIIHPDAGQAGIVGLLAPVIRFERGYCNEDCTACMQVCPSGALKNLNLEQKRHYTIGEALVEGSICFLVQGKSDCDICMRSCPFDAIEIYWDEDLYVAYPNVDSDQCNGCGACEIYCPTGDIKAIQVWKSQT